MTTAREGQELTQVGPGTAMGELMRQYWIPAALSSELERDAAPVRLMLLGEKLIAFRDSGGRVGVMDHRCPRRCASLFLGRNEGGGIRCIYHGWKFDVAGNCVEMPSVPPPQDFKQKVKAKAYRAERVFAVPATEIAIARIGRPFPNAVMLGGLAAFTRIVSLDAVSAAVRERFESEVAERNVAAAREAYKFVEREFGREVLRAAPD